MSVALQVVEVILLIIIIVILLLLLLAATPPQPSEAYEITTLAPQYRYAARVPGEWVIVRR